MQGMLSDSSREVQNWHDKYTELDQKFKAYFEKSDGYIKEKESQLDDLKNQAKDMQYKYANHEEIFKVEKARGDKFEKEFTAMEAPYKQLQE